MRLRAGRELLVVDASNAGLLVEGAARLFPGTHVEVHVVTNEGRVLVRSRVVRAYVSALAASEVRYRCGLAFERAIDTAAVGYTVPTSLETMTIAAGNGYQTSTDCDPGDLEKRVPA